MFKVIITRTDTNEIYTNSSAKNLNEINEWISEISMWLNSINAPFNVGQIQNLTLDSDWLLKEAQRKREAEYPTINEVVEALREAVAENRPQKLQLLQSQVDAIKIKYPKP